MSSDSSKKLQKQIQHVTGKRTGLISDEAIANEIISDPIAAEISMLHQGVELNLKNAIRNAISIGKLLIEKKMAVGHGNFLPWVSANLPFSDRTAARYMRTYENQSLIANAPDLQTVYKMLSNDVAKKEIEINPNEGKEFYLKFKAGGKLSSKQKSLVKEFLSEEKERILSRAKNKAEKIDEELRKL